MMLYKKGLLILMGALLCTAVQAQILPEHPEYSEDAPRNKGNAILLHLALSGHLPAADLADRFGNNVGLGGGLEYITEKNWLLGLEGHYFFGTQVKEDPLMLLRTPEGDIIGNDRLLASVVLRERGYYLGGLVGKLFTFAEKRSGLRTTLSAGWLEHKIRVQDDGNTVTQITGDYRKGYDRLTGGLALQEFIGWQHLGKNRRSNWMFGLEFNQGFTATRRDWDFAAMRKLEGRRLDLRFGLRAAWTLPFYTGGAREIYY